MSNALVHDALLERLGDRDRENLRAVAREIGINPEDAVWSILAALEYYRKLYAEIPDDIQVAVDSIISELKIVAEGEVEAAAGRLVQLGGIAALKQATDVEVAPPKRFTLLFGRVDWGVAAEVAVVLLAIVVSSFFFGQRSGRANAIDEKTAASWATTPDGLKAMQLYQSGELERIVRCNKPGWVVKDDVCYPQPDSGQRLHGWTIP